MGFMTPVLRFCVVFCLVASASALFAADSYVVLYVGNNGSGSHRAIAEKEQESVKKSVEEDFQKSKKSFQEEKKTFLKENPGKKFERTEPARPQVRVAKRGIKTLNEAKKIASDLDKELRDKAAKKSVGSEKEKGTEKESH